MNIPVGGKREAFMHKPRFAVALAAFGFILVARPAFAQYSYEVTLQADYGPKNDMGGCFIGLAAASCGQYFTNWPATGYYNPIEGYALGQYSSVNLGVVARSGPVRVERSEETTFAMLSDHDLAKAYVASNGSQTVTDCPQSGECYSATAHAYSARVQLHADEMILGTIPDTLNGQDVFLKIGLPVTAFGEGSSTGYFNFRLGDDTESASFGSPDVTGPAYSYAKTFQLTTLVRTASSDAHEFALPFSFYGSFVSSTNLGPGNINALNSVGFIPDLGEGLSLRSASGLLDSLLAPPVANVPEPQTYLLLLAGLGLIGLAGRRRHSTLLG